MDGVTEFDQGDMLKMLYRLLPPEVTPALPEAAEDEVVDSELPSPPWEPRIPDPARSIASSKYTLLGLDGVPLPFV